MPRLCLPENPFDRRAHSILLLVTAIAMGGCGSDRPEGMPPQASQQRDETPMGVTETAADEATATPTQPATLSCPFDGAQIAQQTTISAPIGLLAGESGETICYLGTSGSDGDIGIDNTKPLIQVSRRADAKCDYDSIDPGFLPYKGGHRATPEYGEGAWKVVLPSSETQAPGFEAGAHLMLDGVCVEIYLFNRGASEAETEQALDDLVALAKG